ncbi:GNAT family N-acetyltransferase [Aquabacterium sp.]|uniref:GNAT family N-acetyltransferase n=1 Tax=Aquabacterium sp. TaxID=1872578 RepID=UPI003BB21B2E
MTFPLSPDIFLAQSDAELDACFDAYAVLRPHLTRDRFVPQVRRQEAQGFQILGLRDEGRVKSAAGFRLAEFMAWGRVLYIDDLTTLPEARGQGFAGLLLDWLAEYARQQGCQAVHRTPATHATLRTVFTSARGSSSVLTTCQAHRVR